MKKIISLIAVTSILLMGLVSCNIETPRSYSGDLKIVVTNIPADVKAVSFWGNPNEWKLANIEADKELYIVDVENGMATFNLDGYNFSQILWCQIVPMTSKDMALNDSTWWQTAFSGSGTYANAENNLVYDFAANGANDPMTLTLDVKTVYGNSFVIFKNRFTTENYQGAFKASW
jgi:hypothetical protein